MDWIPWIPHSSRSAAYISDNCQPVAWSQFDVLWLETLAVCNLGSSLTVAFSYPSFPLPLSYWWSNSKITEYYLDFCYFWCSWGSFVRRCCSLSFSLLSTAFLITFLDFWPAPYCDWLKPLDNVAFLLVMRYCWKALSQAALSVVRLFLLSRKGIKLWEANHLRAHKTDSTVLES